MSAGAVFVLLAMWAVFAGAGWYVSKAMGRNPAEGLALAVLFGPLGLLVAAALGLYSAVVAPPPPPGRVKATLSPRPASTDVRRR